MKQITTTKSTILVVDVPEGASVAGYIAETNHLYYWTQNCTQSMGDYPYSIVPSEGWKLLGRAKELTEEQWREVVPVDYRSGVINVYQDFIDGGKITQKNGIRSELLGFDTATESGYSLLKANGIVLSNPLGDCPSVINHDVWYSEQEWQEAQSKVTNPLILIKE